MTPTRTKTDQYQPAADDQAVPEPWASVIDLVCANDADYFEKHPDVATFARPMLAGEAWPYEVPEGAWVLVTSIAEGVRARQFIPGPTVAQEVLQ